MIDDPLYLASGTVFVAVGIALVAARRAHRPAAALAVYVLSLGLLYCGYGFWGVPEQTVHIVLSATLGLLATGGLACFAFLFPDPIKRGARADAVFAATYGLVFILSIMAVFSNPVTTGVRSTDAPRMFLSVTFLLIAMVSVGTTILLPLRAYRLPPDKTASARSIGFIAVALLLVSPGGAFPAIVAAGRGEAPGALFVISLLAGIIGSVLWVRATFGNHGKTVRNIFLTLIALQLGLAVVHQAVGDLVVQIGRLFSALILGYAVLAGQIEGLDVKVRWGISRSTIAAAFVTVFFLASEGAQILFGNDNPWVGLVAAGALVFAIAPLQRGAERLAEKAVPLAAPPPPPGVLEESYRDAVRLALLDGALTREEELRLHEIAERLGVSGRRAHAILSEVETETGSGTP